MLRWGREGAIDAPLFAARTLRTMASRRFPWRVAADITRATPLLGYVPDLRNPRSLNEKIMYRKLFAPPPQARVLADKLAVRDYVRETVGDRYLLPVFAVYTSADEIDLGALPKSFVIKANHACGRNLLVHDRDALDPELVRRECRTYLATGFGETTGESWYRDMPRRLIVEELLVEEGQTSPLDYKFWVFHGKPAFVQIDFDRFTHHRRAFYTPAWERMNVVLRREQGPEIAAPAMLGEMLDVASRLAGDLDFVRVDLYSPVQLRRIYFGEMTIAPSAGWRGFGPTTDVDFELGKFWRLS
jgi:hypothetical protein